MLGLIKTTSWLIGYVNILVGFYATNLRSLQLQNSRRRGGGVLATLKWQIHLQTVFHCFRSRGPQTIFRQYESAYAGRCHKQEGEGRREKEGEWRIGEELARLFVCLFLSINKIFCEARVFRKRTKKEIDKEMRHRAGGIYQKLIKKKKKRQGDVEG